MAISIKTPEEIEKMRVAGRLAADVLEMIEPFVKPGVSTGELDRICNDYIVNDFHSYIDYLIVTHIDNDHIKGCIKYVKEKSKKIIDNVWINGRLSIW